MATNQLDDISLAIGELRTDARNQRDNMHRAVENLQSSIDKTGASLQLSIDRAMTSMQTSINSFGDRLDNLPPSKTCLDNHAAITKDITDLKVNSAYRAGGIGALTAGGVLFAKIILVKLGILPSLPG